VNEEKSMDGVFVKQHDDRRSTIDKVSYPCKQMVADFYPYPTPVTSEDALDDTPVHVKVSSHSSGLEDYHAQTEFENNIIPSLILHDNYEGFVVSNFRDDSSNGGRKRLPAMDQPSLHNDGGAPMI
jgi:hypothetical protein